MKSADVPQFLIPREELMRRARQCATIIREMLEHTETDNWIPKLDVWFKTSPDGEEQLGIHALAVDMGNEDEKYGVLRSLGKKFYDEKQVPVATILSAEGWMSSSPLVQGGMMKPGEDPERIEVIAIQAIAGDNGVTGIAKCKRGENDRLMLDGDFELQFVPRHTMNLLCAFYDGFFHDVRKKIGGAAKNN